MPQITRPQSDDMTGFNPAIEKVIECQAGDENGELYTIEKRVPLTETELAEMKLNKAKEAITPLESKLVDGTISEFEMTKLNALYKLISK